MALRSPGRLAGLAALAPIAWGTYSAFSAEHDAPLPEALPGRRRVFDAPTAGRLAYYEDPEPGPGTSAAPLVLLHSVNAAASSYEMRPLFERYRGRRPVYALDLPGFGFSERSRRRYTPDLYVAAIVAFLEGVVNPAQGADLVALSLSAEFAALVALRRPELVRRLVLISPTGFEASARGIRRARELGRSGRIRRALTLPGLAQPLFDLVVSRPSIRYFLAQQFERGSPDPDLLRYAWATAHQPGARHAPLAFLSGELFTPEIRWLAYERLRLPVLVLYARSANTSYEMLPGLLRASDNWQAARIGPAKDLLHWERPAETVAEMDEFFREEMLPAEVGAEGEPAPAW
ncbi:MAG TPA: alpha/beta hydrolase [Gemmatimonadales bacterium]|nr:alpha/beta hydrolase [Gemmatimonadales bacterium]